VIAHHKRLGAVLAMTATTSCAANRNITAKKAPRRRDQRDACVFESSGLFEV
jgi:hypothetical protein